MLLDESFLRSLEQLTLTVRRVTRPGLNGDHRGLTRSNSAEFADYRRYSVGDDFRRIDWNLYGRLGSLFVRLAEAREDVKVHVLIDTSRSMDFGSPNKLDYAKRLGAALGYLALSRLDAVTVNTVAFGLGERFGLLRGKNRARRMLGHLDALKGAGTTELNRTLKTFVERDRPTGIAVVISDFLAPGGYREGLEQLRAARLEVTVLQVLSPEEIHPQAAGDLELVDRETGEVIELTLTDGVVEQYLRRLAAYLHELETTCHQLGVAYHRLATDVPVETAVLTELRAQRIVR